MVKLHVLVGSKLWWLNWWLLMVSSWWFRNMISPWWLNNNNRRYWLISAWCLTALECLGFSPLAWACAPMLVRREDFAENLYFGKPPISKCCSIICQCGIIIEDNICKEYLQTKLNPWKYPRISRIRQSQNHERLRGCAN